MTFNFTVSIPSTVTLVSLSYVGGINAAGTTIAEGGFDPILTLFDYMGTFIARNDDGGDVGDECPIPASAVTGAEYDVCFTRTLDPGNYTVSIQQFDNFAMANLTDGFICTGQPERWHQLQPHRRLGLRHPGRS